MRLASIMSGEDVASADYSSSFSSLEGSSFLSDSRKSSTWGKSGFSSLETLVSGLAVEVLQAPHL